MLGQTRKIKKNNVKNEAGYALKTTATILGFFLLFLSIGLFGYGLWLAIWTNSFIYIDVILNNNIYSAGYILLIISGILLFIVSFFIICGTIQDNPCLLLAFLIVSIISEVILISVATIGIVFNRNFNTNFTANLIFSIQRMYGINLSVNRYREVTQAIDQIQTKFSCCGAIGDTRGSQSWELYNSSTWILVQSKGPPFVPLSCCVTLSDQLDMSSRYCQGLDIYSPTAPPITKTNTKNPYLKIQGCMTTATEFVNYHSYAMFGLALGAAIYLVVMLIISCCLLRHIEVSKQRTELIDSKSALKTNLDSTKVVH